MIHNLFPTPGDAIALTAWIVILGIYLYARTRRLDTEIEHDQDNDHTRVTHNRGAT